jgi:flagellar basal-body rod modification protein FlgD
MSISSVYTSTLTSSTSSSSANSAEEQTQQFLSILLTQLQNQNPLEPMDTTEFTSQIAQYSSLEQQINTNTKLDSLLSAVSAGGFSPMSYLGQTVTFDSDTTVVQGGTATWNYSVDGASSVTLKVTDEAGNVVYSGAGDASSGSHGLVISAGSAANGAKLKLTVTAVDSSGATVEPTITAQATVDAIDSSSGEILLEAAGYQFSADLVTRVATPAAATTTTETTEAA